MKKILFGITCFICLMVKVNALTILPATIEDKDSSNTVSVELNDQEVLLPEFCSIGTGCTISADKTVLQTIGKYNFGSGQEYFYAMNGTGATFYEEKGPHPAEPAIYAEKYNIIEINPTGLLESEKISIGTGAGEESRTFTLVATKVTTTIPNEDKDNAPTDGILEDNPTENDDSSNLKEYLVIGLVSVVAILVIILAIVMFKRKNKRL